MPHREILDKSLFDQLNDADLFKMLDQMDFEELVNVADLGERYRQLAIKHYMIPIYEVNEKSIKFSPPTIPEPLLGLLDVEILTKNEIIFRSIPIFIKTLRNFGHLISKLEYNGFNANKSAGNLMEGAINEYCGDALIEISCVNFDGATMNEWKTPFENVENVAFGSGSMKSHVFSRLNEIFPKLRRLSLIRLVAHEKSFIEQHYPYLEYLELFYITPVHSIDIEQLIASNRQLKTLHLSNELETESPTFLRGKLPELEELSFILSKTNQFGDCKPTYLPHVRRLKIESQSSDYREPEHFPFILPELEELELTLTKDIDQWIWIQVITQMDSLRKLKIVAGSFTTEQWTTIIDILSSLEEITVEISDFMPGSIIEAMENHESLQMATFGYMSDINRQYFCDKINPNWKLTSEHREDTSRNSDTVFERMEDDDTY